MRATPSPPPPGRRREEVQALAGVAGLFVITAAWWALALWPLDAGPSWIERTRYVCFGALDGGLPDAGGWIGLIGGPAGMLGILAAGWGGALRRLLRRAPASPALAAGFGALGLGGLTLLAGAGVRVAESRAAASPAFEAAPLPGTYARLDRPAPALGLVSQHGDTLDLASLRGRPVLVTFAYAHCQTVCPLVVKNALTARAALAGTAAEPAVVILTLDAWRDTPSRLPAMAESWGLPREGVWVLSGAVEDVEAALDAWEVPRTRDTATGEVTHPSLVYVVDAEGRIAFAATGGGAALGSLVHRL